MALVEVGRGHILFNNKQHVDSNIMAGKAVIKNIFEVACKTLRGQTVELSQFMGKVILIENVASL